VLNKKAIFMKIFLIILTIIIPSPLLANNIFGESSCFNEYIDSRKLSELPPEIKENLDDMFNGKLGDSDAILKEHSTDVKGLGITNQQYNNLPRNKFKIGFKFQNIYVVFIDSADSLPSSLGYRLEKQDGKYNLYPWYYFSGPICGILTTIQNNVINPSNLPKDLVDAIID
jgi:hypothetical protein